MHRILVVDDEPQIIRLLNEFLTKSGFEVITAGGGEEAIGILQGSTKVDLMIIDIKMPKVDGLDVLREKSHLKNKAPAIILTGSLDAGKYLVQLKELGYKEADILYKPIDLFVLLKRVKEKLGL